MYEVSKFLSFLKTRTQTNYQTGIVVGMQKSSQITQSIDLFTNTSFLFEQVEMKSVV